jgi:hypothetical protein
VALLMPPWVAIFQQQGGLGQEFLNGMGPLAIEEAVVFLQS